MRALEVWYDKIDEVRERLKRRVEKERGRTVPEHDYPKLVEHHVAIPRIKDNPPLMFHPTAEQAPGLKTGLSRSDRGLPRVAGRARPFVRSFSFLRLGIQSRRRGQCRHFLRRRTVPGRRRQPAFPAGQGGKDVSAGAISGEELASESRPASRCRSAPCNPRATFSWAGRAQLK
jgi:hypothetical protein